MKSFWEARSTWAPAPEYSQVCARAYLLAAWREVRRGRGRAPGIDGIRKPDFDRNATEYIEEIYAGLESRTYSVQPARGAPVEKSNGRVRWLGVPTMRDRIVGRAIHNELTRTLHDQLAADSYAYRPTRGQKEALRAAGILSRRHAYCLVLDIADYFDTIDHQRLMARLEPLVDEPAFLDLIQLFLGAGVVIDGRLETPGRGLLQGAPLSPFLANLYIAPLVTAVRTASEGSIHYGDDFAIFSDSRKSLQEVRCRIEKALEDCFGLAVNSEKCAIADLRHQDVKLLGYWFNGKYARPDDGKATEIVQAVTSVPHWSRKRDMMQGYMNGFDYGDTDGFWRMVADLWPDGDHRRLQRQAFAKARARAEKRAAHSLEALRYRDLLGRLKWHPRMSLQEAFGDAGPLAVAMRAGAA